MEKKRLALLLELGRARFATEVEGVAPRLSNCEVDNFVVVCGSMFAREMVGVDVPQRIMLSAENLRKIQISTFELL